MILKEKRLRVTALVLDLDVVAAALLLICVVLALGWRAEHGIWFSTFSDESGHIVGARAISAGYTLYRDFVDEHGPLIYALPQLYGALAGWSSPNYVRVIPVIFLALTSLSVSFSPVFSSRWERLLAPAVFIGLVDTVWLVQGLYMVDYQPLAGMLMVIGLAQFTLPVWYGCKVRSAGLFASGLAFGLVPFFAFTYGPASLLFGVCGAWVRSLERPREKLLYFFWGITAAVTCSLIWLTAFADLRGYIAFHFIASLRFYAPYMPPAGRIPALTVLWPSLAPQYIVQAIGTGAAIAAGGALVASRLLNGPKLRAHLLLPFVTGCVGLVLTNPRGSPIFQDDAFIVVSFCLVSITWTVLPQVSVKAKAFSHRLLSVAVAAIAIITTEGLAHLAVTSPHGYTRLELSSHENGRLDQSDDPWSRKLRLLTDPGEPTLALPFYPDFYLQAGRLPMKGYYIYLPWDADFAMHPVLGIDHDLCHNLARALPPVIFYNGWVVWGKYNPESYMTCVLGVLERDYEKIPGEAELYVRRDRAARLNGRLR